MGEGGVETRVVDEGRAGGLRIVGVRVRPLVRRPRPDVVGGADENQVEEELGPPRVELFDNLIL